MSSTSVDLGAVRRLTGSHGDPSDRVADAERLADAVGGDRVIRALVRGLRDDSSDVRTACERSLRRQFRSGEPSVRRTVVRRLFVTLAGDEDPPRETVSLLRRVVKAIRRNRTEQPNLFATVMSEAERARSGGSYPQSVRTTLKDIYELADDEESRSETAAKRFNLRRSREQLRSETTPRGELRDALRLLGDRRLSEATPKTVLYHLYPIVISHDYEVMNRAVGNLRDWTRELPQDDRFELADAVETLRAYRRNSIETLPWTLRNEVALAELAVDVLGEELERLDQFEEYSRIVTPVLATLEGTVGARDHVDTVLEFVFDSDEKKQRRAVSLLSTLLTGLDTETRRLGPRIEDVYDDQTATVDRQIRETFTQLSRSQTAPESVAQRAVREVIHSRPDSVGETLGVVLDTHDIESPVVETALETVAEEAVLSAADPVVSELESLGSEDADRAELMIETLEQLGHDPARRALVSAARPTDGAVADHARDALVRSGYYEHVRSLDTRSRATAFAKQSEQSESSRESAEHSRQTAKREYKRLESQLRQEVFEADQQLRRGLVSVLERRIDSLDTLIELYQVDRRVEKLVERASRFDSEVGSYLGQVTLEDGVRTGIREEFAAVDQDLTYLERLTESDDERVAELEERLAEFSEESDDGPDDLQTELRRRERETLEELRDSYRSASTDRRRRLSDLRSKLDRKQSQLQSVSVERTTAVSDVHSTIDAVESAASRIDGLTDQRAREWSQVQDAIERGDSRLSEALGQLTETVEELESVQARIDDLTKRVSDLRLDQQHTSQRSHEQRETHRQIKPREGDEVNRRVAVAAERSSFYEHRQLYSSFLRRLYEQQLDEVARERFRDQYHETISQIRTEIREYR